MDSYNSTDSMKNIKSNIKLILKLFILFRNMGNSLII